MPGRFARIGDPWAEMDQAAGSLEGLLEQAARDEAAGLPDAPWPPHYDKQAGEAPRVQPSKRRDGSAGTDEATGAGGASGARGARGGGSGAQRATGTGR